MPNLQMDGSIKEEISLAEAEEGSREFDKETRFQRFIRHFFTPLLIILVASFSFGFGRFSKIIESQEPIRIETAVTPSESLISNPSNLESVPTVAGVQAQGNYVASKSGTKYHLPWCSGAVRIKDENKIWFTTKDEAQKAGYTPAANCKGI